MPVRNEADFIHRSLGSVLAQSYPDALLDVIVADGMSSDGTRETVAAMAAESGIPVNVVDNPGLTAPCGLNAAIAKATGDVVIRVDGHCEIDRDYVKNCVRHLEGGEADGVGGPIETIGETPVAEAIAAAMSSKFGVGGSAFRCVDDRAIYVDTVAFPAYRRDIFSRIGLFNEELVRNQDDEFNFRLRKSGGRILLSPDIRSRYYSRGTLRLLWRQYLQYGFWKIRVMQLHPRQMSLRHFAPAAFVAGTLILAIAAIFIPAFRYVGIVAAAAYLAAGLVSAVYSIRKVRLWTIPILPLCYFILHFSYGLGFIGGLFHFRSHWRTADSGPALNDRA